MTKVKEAADHRVLKVETSFQKKTMQPGGISRSDAIVAAQNSVLEMQTSIESILDEKLADLEMRFSRSGAAKGNPLDDIRAMHDLASILRDLGGVVGFNLITYVAESLCKFCQVFEKRGSVDAAIVECHMKTMRLVRAEGYRTIVVEDVPHLKSGFESMLQKVAAVHSY